MPEIIAHTAQRFLNRAIEAHIQTIETLGNLHHCPCLQPEKVRCRAADYVRLGEYRPWGFYEVVAEKPNCKIKRITVYPGQRLSYQRHFKRTEHWYILSGVAVATQNKKEIELASGHTIDLPVKAWHRIYNQGTDNLVFIEVQTGDYLEEDDIERSEDDYGRICRINRAWLRG